MNASFIFTMILTALTFFAFVPTSFAEDAAPAEGTEQQSTGRDPASKHKHKKKHHGRRAHRHHNRK